MADSVGAVPQGQQQQTATQGVDILNQLLAQRDKLTEGITALTKQAAIPVAASGQGTSPQLSVKPVPQFNPTPLINKPTVGARSTRDQGIANTIISAANIVGQVREKHEQEQQRVLAVDLERVFQAQDGIRQAQQTLQLDPNNADAKGVLQKNQNVIDAMLSDPKRRKQFEKALDVSFTDPTKNDQMEHGALQKAAESYSQQLDKQIPQQMQPNVIAQQKLALATAQQQSIDKMIGQIAPTLVREQGAQQRAQMSDQTKRDIATYETESRAATAKLTAATHYQAVVDGAKIHSNALITATAMRNQQSAANVAANINSRMDLMKTKLDDPIFQLKGSQANSKLITDQLNSLTKQNAQLTARKQQLMAMKANKLISDKDYANQMQGFDSLIKANDSTIKDYQSMHDQNSAYVENLIKGLQSGSSDSNTVSPGTSTGHQSVGPEEDIEGSSLDPDNY